MKLRQIFEAPQKVAVTAFGRMNPPTIGHDKLVNKITEIEGDHYLFLSQTQKPKDNPLPFDVKLQFAKKFFPSVNVGHPTVRTPIQMLQMLEKLGYTDIVYVAGSDRVEQFEKLFNDYNGKEYNFNSIRVVSAGERDPDADGAEGMSASKMRVAAAAGDFDSFAQGVPSPALAQKLYDAVRAGMGVKDTVPSEAVAERVRDPEDWDEGNTEPPNNFAVYINGKKWKVFKGRGQFADDYKEIQHYRQLQNWAQAKSQATGKKWTVSITGEPATESVAEGVALPDISGLGYNAQSLIMKLRRDVEEKRIQATPQAVLAAARELAGDMDFAPQLLVKQVLGRGMAEAAYEGNIGIMELFKFFSKAEKEDPKLVARVKEMIKQRRDREVWRIIQDYTGTQLTGKEFEGSIKEAIFREAGHGKYWCSTDKKWKYRQGPKQSRSS